MDAEVECSRAGVRCSIPEPGNLAEKEEVDLICLSKADGAQDWSLVDVQDWRDDRVTLLTLGNLNRAYLRRGAGLRVVVVPRNNAREGRHHQPHEEVRARGTEGQARHDGLIALDVEAGSTDEGPSVILRSLGNDRVFPNQVNDSSGKRWKGERLWTNGGRRAGKYGPENPTRRRQGIESRPRNLPLAVAWGGRVDAVGGVSLDDPVAPEEAKPRRGVLDGLQRRGLNNAAAHLATVRSPCVCSSV